MTSPRKVLAIGNSFSEDATACLSRIAASAGVELTVGNLYIGGCPLERHWKNVTEDAHEYIYYRFIGDGMERVENAAIRETLLSEDWDFVTLQQASHDSGKWDTYEPYLSQLSAYVKQTAPQAEQLIHQTWAYEIDSDHGGFARYQQSQSMMFAALQSAYQNAARTLSARIIPCGEAMQLARQTSLFDYAHGGKSLCRDGFHARIPHGRYLLGAVWFETLTGRSMESASFLPSTETEIISEAEAAILRECAHQAVRTHSQS